MNALILRLDAPLMSFGTVMVDHHGFIDRFPGTAMFVGLIGNALGWEHRDAERLTALQNRLQYAARWDVAPEEMVDYQTVDLAQSKMADPFWTTRGKVERRAGGSASKGTHQRYRHFWANGLMTVAMSVDDDADPDLATIGEALARPARPLFLGRKVCLPSRPVLDPHQAVRVGPDVLTILCHVEVWDRTGTVIADATPREGCWPAHLSQSGLERTVYDLRDWSNQLMTGARRRREGLVRRDSSGLALGGD